MIQFVALLTPRPFEMTIAPSTVHSFVDVVERGSARATGLAELYHDDAINHQVTQGPVEGREAIGRCLSGSLPPPKWFAS